MMSFIGVKIYKISRMLQVKVKLCNTDLSSAKLLQLLS